MWHKDWGARVKKGDILAEINAPALDAQYRQSKADLASEVALYDLAELTADRYIALRKNQAVSEQSISVKVAEGPIMASQALFCRRKLHRVISHCVDRMCKLRFTNSRLIFISTH